VLVFFFLSCTTREDFGPQYASAENTPIDSLQSGTIVINEGNFGYENASLSIIDQRNKSIENNVFQRVNGKNLGDVAQSCLVVDSFLVILVNNSNRIRVLHLKSWKEYANISINASPRYAKLVDGQILVSTMGTAGIKRLDIENKSVEDWAKSSGWQEEMIQYEGDLFVCNRDKHQIDVYDIQNRSLKKSIRVGKDPESLVEKNGFICVLSTGGWDRNNRTFARLVRINPNTYEGNTVYSFPNIEESPTRLRKSSEDNTLYFINQGVWKFNLNASALHPEKISDNQAGIWYGLNVHPINGSIYATNAGDYVSSGVVYHFGKDEKLLETYQAGIIPSFVAFY
jgi:hypothetical protein